MKTKAFSSIGQDMHMGVWGWSHTAHKAAVAPGWPRHLGKGLGPSGASSRCSLSWAVIVCAAPW